MVEPQRRAPQAGHSLDVTPAGIVLDFGAVATRDDLGPYPLMRPPIRARIQMMRDIGGRERIAKGGHSMFLDREARG